VETILLAMDESENAMRAAQYVGRMLGGSCKLFDVTMVYVLVRPSADLFEEPDGAQKYEDEAKRKMEAVFARAAGVLQEAGLPAANIRSRLIVTEEPGIAQGLLGEQKAGRYSTLVVGRRGVTKAEEFLFGSVSNKVIHHAADCAVWVVQ
jgi:nucleotide-binding universal stress UspA family protein